MHLKYLQTPLKFEYLGGPDLLERWIKLAFKLLKIFGT